MLGLPEETKNVRTKKQNQGSKQKSCQSKKLMGRTETSCPTPRFARNTFAEEDMSRSMGTDSFFADSPEASPRQCHAHFVVALTARHRVLAGNRIATWTMPSWGSRVSGRGVTTRRRLSTLSRRKSSRPAEQDCSATDPLHFARPGGLLSSSLRQRTVAFVARSRCYRDLAARQAKSYLCHSSKGCERRSLFVGMPASSRLPFIVPPVSRML